MTLIGTVSLMAGSLTLLVSGIAHAVTPSRLRATLDDHAVLPHAVRSSVVVALPAGELALSAAAPLHLLEAGGIALPALLCGQVVLFGLLAVYSRRLVAVQAGATCGCGWGDAAASRWTTRRAASFGVLAAIASVTAVPGWPFRVVSVESTIAVTAGVTFALLLWQLPLALSDVDRAGSRPDERVL